jgi:hypothetical protein
MTLCRELTKRYEEAKQTTIGEALAWYKVNEPKGEMVLVIEGKPFAELKKEQEAVNQFCQQNGVSCWHEDGQIHVQTPQSKWKIITSGKGNKLFLYHKNAFHKEESIPSIIPGYHSQAARSKTIVGYLEYIVQHDTYWKRQKKKAKQKADSMKNLRRNTRRYQRGTDNRRYNANQLYSIMESVYL